MIGVIARASARSYFGDESDQSAHEEEHLAGGEQDVRELGVVLIGVLDEVPGRNGDVQRAAGQDHRVPSVSALGRTSSNRDCRDSEHPDHPQPGEPVSAELLACGLELIVAGMPACVEDSPCDDDDGRDEQHPDRPPGGDAGCVERSPHVLEQVYNSRYGHSSHSVM